MCLYMSNINLFGSNFLSFASVPVPHYSGAGWLCTSIAFEVHRLTSSQGRNSISTRPTSQSVPPCQRMAGLGWCDSATPCVSQSALQNSQTDVSGCREVGLRCDTNHLRLLALIMCNCYNKSPRSFWCLDEVLYVFSRAKSHLTSTNAILEAIRLIPCYMHG